jgi:hypothetical protein
MYSAQAVLLPTKKLYRNNLLWSHDGIACLYNPTFPILQTSCLICKLHTLHYPLHSCPCPSNSSSSFFLLCFILSSLPSFHFWLVFNCCFIIVGDVVDLSLHLDEFGDGLSCLLLVHHYPIVCTYGLHGMAVSVHPVFSTVCTMVGVALPYCVHVHATWYGSFCTPDAQYCLYHH